MDSTAHFLYAAHELDARSGGMGGDTGTRPASYKIVGLVLAIASGLFIGSSFVIKKHGLLQANTKYNEEAGEGYGYLKNAWWWLGMTLMIVGEICNLVAYAFTDAILVTPMGALSVVVCAILSTIFLKERLSFVGKVGCFNCIIGSVVIAVNAPQQSSVARIEDMKRWVLTPGFLSYAGVIVVACVIIAIWVAPKYGKKTMMVYITICSLIGGLSVVATQGLGAAVVAQASGTYGGQFKQWFLYVLLVFVVITLLTEIIYLNKALNLFNAALVTPTYYVFFTSATIVTSAVLFQGFKGTPLQIVTVIMGFFQICSGVVLLQLSKSAKDVPDSAVFKGDLDQVRTVAEMEEPEYEPRADALRGGSAIIRSLSKARSHKELAEAKKIQEEHMEPIGEGEQVEFDGLRRRKTILDPSRPPTRNTTIVQTRTIHPPLGMSQFPTDDSDDDNDSFHPGFFQRLRSRGKSTSSRDSARTPVHSVVGMQNLPPIPQADGSSDRDSDVNSYKHDMSRDTSYKSHDTSYKPLDNHIQFASLPDPPRHHERNGSGSSSLAPPRASAQTAKRQFSFQNVFTRSRPDSMGESSSSKRPTSRHSRKSSRERAAVATATEEERLGLVKGDSANLLPIVSHGSNEAVPELAGPPVYSDDWDMVRTESPGYEPERIQTSQPGVRRVETDMTELSPRDDKEYEKNVSGQRRFL
ncbi:RhaT Permease metabolite transporter DMT superfamily [Pyrenophora tritici-repentis]|uniref:Magnesium transporter NIPA n=1 Tax=Pyrenophora tritici-repentis TaxID=45151 RepID=A0A2W1EXE2_9PLEO|nr:RhaT Permease drug-metabolite transporter superfamily [Pyrenophora tritici-repentis]KAF7455296.1 RhaT Permease drug-metabolite transporter superfamily [Pyrenophora tritici-repentis]KAF7578476.1 RhaT, Permease drug-metabolite transporter (DMT) superfamily [Pyrenophora tritici-repentis]KAI0573867.1 RhaT Permease drug-metabolite transporter (DMT) superfamily [Pyrenophora tritici-repentis]KAI0584743.1 RhaT Permease drug-metabolite transporter (DMT) superfamily [Pyrenophora tritici-repentis]